jgi:rubrerythrin
MQEALDQARKLEMDGIEFYTGAAEQCGVLSGKRMFESFAADERRHLKVIREVAEGLGVDIEGMPMPRDEIRTLFTTATENLGDYVEATEGERDAVQVAMGMEKESYDLYAGQAETAQAELARQLFERLAREENQHYEMLENTLEYLNSNEEWFLWKEWALIVGDQS